MHVPLEFCKMQSHRISNMDSFVEKQHPNRIRVLPTIIFLWFLKFVFILIALAILCIIGYAISLQFSVEVRINEVLEVAICETEECRRKAESLRRSMNVSVDPCDNFYEFACGNWKSGWGEYEYVPMVETQTQITWNLIDLVEGINENDTLSMQQLKIIYDSCVKFNIEKDELRKFPSEMWEPANFQETLERAHELIGLGKSSEPATSKRRRICIRYMEDRLMPYAAAHKYILAHVKYEDIVNINEIYANLRTSLINLVWSLDWMDPATKQRVTERTEETELYHGFPKWIVNPETISECYQGLNFTSGGKNATFPEHFLTWLMWRWESKTNSSRKCFKTTQWDSTGYLGDGPGYALEDNGVVIPAGIMRQPYFNNGLRAVDYAALGMILGHELLHGFQWNDERVLPSVHANDSIVLPRWSSTTKKEYAEKVKCFQKQYDNYWLTDVGGNPGDINKKTSNSSSEDISDNVGLHIAHKAYRLYVDQTGNPEPRLVTLEQYSAEQIFFLSFANVWCSSTRIPSMKDLESDDEHSPLKYRVIGSLSNSAAFSKAWRCPDSSRMNPKTKCTL